MPRVLSVLINASSGNLRGALLSAAGAVSQFEHSLTRTAQKSSVMTGLMTKGFLAVGTAVVTALGYGVVKAAEFEKSMRNVNSLTGLSEQAFRAQEQAVIAMSTRLPQSAKVLADGLYNIASSGFQGADGLTVLNAAATAASAGLTTTDNSAKAITAVLNAYGRSAKDAGDVSDVLFQTVNLGVITFDELSGVIGDVVGTAAAAKVGIDQVGSAIATMTLSGITGAEAGTSLNRVLQSLIRPSTALQDMYRQLGYSSGAAALETKGLRGVMEDLRVATGGNITTLLELFPEIRAARGALALMSNEGQNYAKVAGQIEDVDKRRGATQKVLNEQMKAASNQLQLFRNQIDAVAINTGAKLLPVLVKLMTLARETGTTIGNDLVAGARKVVPFFEALGRAGYNVWQVLLHLWDAVSPVVKALATLGGLAVVGMLIGLAKALANVAGFLAQHQTLVLALALAYGVTLMGGLAGVVGMVGKVGAGFRMLSGSLLVSRALIAQAGGAATVAGAGFNRLSQAMLGVSAAEAAMTLGVTAVIAALISVWTKWRDTAAQTNEVVDRAMASMSKRDPQDMAKNIDAVSKKMAELRAQLDRPWNQKLFDTQSGVQLEHQLGRLQDTYLQLRNTQNRVAANTRQLGVAFGLTGDQVQKLAAAGKIDLSKPFGEAATALAGYIRSTGASTTSSATLMQAMSQLQQAAGDTAKQVQTLKDTLDALMGKGLSLNAAARGWGQALADLGKQAQAGAKGIDPMTEAGRANGAALDGAAGKLRDYLKAQADAGVKGPQLVQNFNSMRDAIMAQATAILGSRAAAEAWAKQIGLVPTEWTTMLKQIGAEEATAKAHLLGMTIGGIPNRDALVTQHGASPAMVAVAGLEATIASLQTAKTALIRQYGAEGAAAQVAALDAQIRALQDKQVTITTQYLTYGVPAPSGGGRVIFAEGGPVRGPGGPTDDNIPAWLSSGEYVVRAAAVARYGEGFLDRVNRMAFADGGRVPDWRQSYSSRPSQVQTVVLSGAGGGEPLIGTLNVPLYGSQLSAEQVAGEVMWQVRRARRAGRRV